MKISELVRHFHGVWINRSSSILYACLLVLTPLLSNAAGVQLESRLGGLAYYDPNLNITWAADANLQGFGSNWNINSNWVAALSIGGVGGWRLPSADVNGDATIDFCTGGAGDCEDNELAHLYWKQGITPSTPGVFSNVLVTTWWSETEFAPSTGSAWYTSFINGSTGANSKSTFRFAWAVRTGDVLGLTQMDPILPGSVASGVFSFINAQSGNWFDPPTVNGYTYTMDGGSLFTGILGFPTGFNSAFEVLVGGSSLGLFNPGEQVDFGTGVSSFTIQGIDPFVDPDDPSAFPLQLEFNTTLADFTMSAVPIPAAFWLFGSVLMVLIGVARQKKA